MTMRCMAGMILLAGAMMQPASAQRTSFRPGDVWPDNNNIPINAHGGGILLHEGVYYWFGEHKIEGKAGNFAQVGVHAYSSKDLYNWKDEGIALAVSKDPTNDITAGCILERPKVIRNDRTKQFVMWFHLELKGTGYKTARSGVAVSERVTGPYRFVASFRNDAGRWPENLPVTQKKVLNEEEEAAEQPSTQNHPPVLKVDDSVLRRDLAGGQMARDMTLFVDDDGRAYLIAASEENSALHLSQLTDDYLRTMGRYVRLFPGDFNEAPAMFKRNGRYYLITSGCSSWNPNAARSAVADCIWGPYTKLGNPCRGTNEQKDTTFKSQSTFVLPAPGKTNDFIFMADRWRPQNAIDGRYIWLPVEWEDDKPVLHWHDQWDLSFFKSP